eukprot:m.317687 g.317687  ORF g.317687 m.317687 type:complete len:459 (-) comp19690_c0_seq2:91-1467(-)
MAPKRKRSDEDSADNADNGTATAAAAAAAVSAALNTGTGPSECTRHALMATLTFLATLVPGSLCSCSGDGTGRHDDDSDSDDDSKPIAHAARSSTDRTRVRASPAARSRGAERSRRRHTCRRVLLTSDDDSDLEDYDNQPIVTSAHTSPPTPAAAASRSRTRTPLAPAARAASARAASSPPAASSAATPATPLPGKQKCVSNDKCRCRPRVDAPKHICAEGECFCASSRRRQQEQQSGGTKPQRRSADPPRRSPVVFAYVMPTDANVAPNVSGGWCTLSTCKGAIRSKAQPGDFIVALSSVVAGQGPASRKIVWVGVVGQSLTFAEYWRDERFQCKKQDAMPGFADNLYEPTDDGHFVAHWDCEPKIAQTHFYGLNVLIMAKDKWTYFGGAEPLPVPDNLAFVRDAMPYQRRQHQCFEHPDQVAAVAEFVTSCAGGIQGRPQLWQGPWPVCEQGGLAV